MTPTVYLLLLLPALGLAFVALKLGQFFSARIQFLHDPVYVPSQDQAVVDMLTLAKPQKGQLVLDLGSGDGKLVIAFAKLGCQVIGYEIDPFLVWTARRRIHQLGLEKCASVKWQSFWQADVGQADVVVIFATASIMEKLGQKLATETKNTAKIISERFIFPNWPDKKKLGECRLYRASDSASFERVRKPN